MKNPVKTGFFLSLIFLLGGTSVYAAFGYNTDEIADAIADYHEMPRASDADQALASEVADALADETAILGPVPFNDLVGHLLADYRHHSKHRASIADLLQRLRQRILPELKEEHSKLNSVLDGVILAWTAVYVYSFGKGLWKSRGSGLRGLPLFRHVVKKVTENLPVYTLKLELKTTGTGIALGAAQAVYYSLETHRMDPLPKLALLQKQILDEHEARIIDARRKKQPLGDAAESQLAEELIELHKEAPALRKRINLLLEELRIIDFAPYLLEM